MPNQQEKISPSYRSGHRLKWIAVLGFWLLILLISISSKLVHTPSCRNVVEAISLFDVPNYGAWALVSPLILLISGKLVLDREKWKSRLALLFVLGIAIGLLQSIPSELVNVAIDQSTEHEKSLSHSLFFHIVPTMPVKFLIFCAILGMGYAFDYYRRFQERTARLGRMEKQLVQAKLDALKSQLHPHFLFNTLNAISALVEKDPHAARRMIARLSELLRLTLDSKDKNEITLDHELSLLRHYLAIEQVRFQDRLKLQYEIAADVQKALVPNMILQPLVENAIRHGISQRRRGGSIKISAARENGFLKLSVEDDGPGLDKNGSASTFGVGLENTQSRLVQMYGDRHHFKMENLEDHGLKVSLSLPLHHAPG
ncbi:histidine kinase [bacterium]|nr:histidine kinase [bacterium]